MSVQSFDEISLSFINDISSTKTYYKMQDSELDPPTAPTSNPPTGWSSTEPAHTTGASEKMYTVICTEFSDGSFSYSEVSESASYTAVNEAQSTADQAISDAADAAKTATNYIGTDETLDAVIVGDMTADELGANTRMTSAGVEIRNGQTVLARFLKNLLEIGANSSTSTIDLGKGRLKMYNETGGRLLQSEDQYTMLRSDQSSMVLQSQYTSSDERVDDSAYNGIYLWNDRSFPVTWVDDRSYIKYICPECGRQLNPLTEIKPDVTRPDYVLLKCPFDGYVVPDELMGITFPAYGGNPGYYNHENPIQDGVFLCASRSRRQPSDNAGALSRFLDAWMAVEMRRDPDDPDNTLYGLISLMADRYKIKNPAEFRRALNSDKYAAITVQYPSDSKCYCENEELGITYEALDEIGSYEFVIPSNQLGTWKITIFNSEKTASRTVMLSEDERTAHVTMSYWNGELFDSGDQFTDITGGWKIANYKNAVESTFTHCDIGTRLYVYGSGGRDCAIITEEPVDMTEFTKLVVEYDRSLTSGAAHFGVFRSNVEPLNAQTANNIANLAFSTSKDMLTLDITSITGMMYPVIYTGTSSSTHNADVIKMYMLR